MLRLNLLALWPLLLHVAQAAPLNVTSQAVIKRDVNTGWPYSKEKIRGVNIGGVSHTLMHIVSAHVLLVACVGALDHSHLVRQYRQRWDR